MPKAKKEYKCDYCDLQIAKGTDYFKVHDFDEEHELFELKAHNECENFMQAVGALDDGYSYEPEEEFDNEVETWFVEIDYNKFYKEHPDKNFGSDHQRTLRYLVGIYDKYSKKRIDFEGYERTKEEWTQIHKTMEALRNMVLNSLPTLKSRVSLEASK